MSVVVKCVNVIRTAALKRREFRQLLNGVGIQYGELLHTEVSWLLRDKSTSPIIRRQGPRI